MKKLIILIIIILTAYQYSKADQYLHIDAKTAERAIALLANENEAIIYCPSCSDSSKESITNASFSYNEFRCGRGIHIYGTGKNGSKWCSAIDLAYLHIKRGDKAIAIAELLDLPSLIDSTQKFSSSFDWIERKQEYWKPKEAHEGPNNIVLQFNSASVNFRIDQSSYNFDSTSVRHTLVPEVFDSGSAYVGEYPEMEYFENEQGDIEMFYFLFDSMKYDQQMTLTQEEIFRLTDPFPFSNGLELIVNTKCIKRKNEYYRLLFPYKGLLAEIVDSDWGMFYYYTNEGGFPPEIILNRLEFVTKDCSLETTYEIGNIRLVWNEQ